MSALRRLARTLTPAPLRAKLRNALQPPGDWRGVADLRDVTDDPVTALYTAIRDSPVVNVPVAWCRGFEPVGMPLTPEHHPFIQTLLAWREGRVAAYRSSPLAEYHRHFCPRSAGEVLGLGAAGLSVRLAGLPAAAAVLPWWSDAPRFAPEARAAALRSAAAQDYREAGMAPGDGATMYWFGPFPEELGAMEWTRLIRLHAAVARDGFRRSDAPGGDILGCVLAREDGAVRVLINGGQHRGAVAVACGMHAIPVRLFPTLSPGLIARGHVDHWPHVRSGLFTRAQALQVFDRIFEGIPSSAPSLWPPR